MASPLNVTTDTERARKVTGAGDTRGVGLRLAIADEANRAGTMKIIREVANFQSQLNRERQPARERIGRINRLLHEIDYERGRYIVLEGLS